MPIATIFACSDGEPNLPVADACPEHACPAADGAASTPTDGAVSPDASREGSMADASVADAPSPGDAGCAAPCDDHNACTRDDCRGGTCVHAPEPDGTPCDDGQLCTSSDACLSGVCVGTPRTSSPRVVTTAYSFGGAYVKTDIEISRGGLVRFVSPERLLFADRLDSDSTLLTVVDVTASTLRPIAQTVTDAILQVGELTGWIWQAVPVSQLVVLPNDRFALFTTGHIQVFQLTSDHRIAEIWRTTANPESVFDAAWAGDSIWACRAGAIVRYALQPDGSLLETPAPDLTAYTGCIRMVVAPDGVNVYASNPGPSSTGVIRFSASGGPSIASEVVLPGVVPIDMAIDDRHLVLQRVGQEGDFGDTEVYRLSDFVRVAAFSQSLTSTPFALALSSGNLFLEWQRNDATSERVTGAVYGLGDDGPTALAEWTFRTRAAGTTDPWAVNVERLVTAGSRVVTGPWRRVADIDPTTGSPSWITGPGHGEIVGLRSTGSGVATFSPYSVEQFDLASDVQFSAGGMILPDGLRRLQMLLPDEGPVSSFMATPPSDEQRTETEAVTVMRAGGAAGLEVAGEFSLDGGPAKLVQRGKKLYQVKTAGGAGYQIREFTLGPSIVGQAPLAADAEYALTVPGATDASRVQYFFADIDPLLRQIAIAETRVVSDAGAIANTLVWASLDSASATVIASASVHASAMPVIRGGRVMLLDSLATLYAPDGEGGVTEIGRASCGIGCLPPLGVDGPDRIYLPYLTSEYRVDLAVLGMADASVLSHLSIPDMFRTATVAGDRLLLGATHSISVLEPSCGVVADGGTDDVDAAADGAPADGSDAASMCGEVPHCPEGGLTRSSLVGDANGDGCVDAADVTLVVACFGASVTDVCGKGHLADVDGNGTVDVRDYVKVVANQGHGCGEAGP